MNTLSPSAPCPAWTFSSKMQFASAYPPLTMPHSPVSGINRNGRIVPCEPSFCRWCGIALAREAAK